MASTSGSAGLSKIQDHPFETELNRIRAAYERREREVPRDRYSDTNPRAAVFYRELESNIFDLLARKCPRPLSELRVLDLGCGEGRWLRRLPKWGLLSENLSGVDLLPGRVAASRASCHPGVRFYCVNAAQLPFADRSLDVVLCMTVFSSILDEGLRMAVATEMLRVLRPDGFVLWYDFFVRNPARGDVRRVGKADLARLFPDCEIGLKRVTVVTPLGRAVATIPGLYSALSRFPIFSTHYLGYIQKR